jgi:hypothetical protein
MDSLPTLPISASVNFEKSFQILTRFSVAGAAPVFQSHARFGTFRIERCHHGLGVRENCDFSVLATPRAKLSELSELAAGLSGQSSSMPHQHLSDFQCIISVAEFWQVSGVKQIVWAANYQWQLGPFQILLCLGKGISHCKSWKNVKTLRKFASEQWLCSSILVNHQSSEGTCWNDVCSRGSAIHKLLEQMTRQDMTESEPKEGGGCVWVLWFATTWIKNLS